MGRDELVLFSSLLEAQKATDARYGVVAQVREFSSSPVEPRNVGDQNAYSGKSVHIQEQAETTSTTRDAREWPRDAIARISQ